jgi:hypothetical protein
MHIWPVSKVENFESLLGFHSVDAGLVALVLFDFLLSSWWYSLRFILVIIHEAMERLVARMLAISLTCVCEISLVLAHLCFWLSLP